MVSYLDYLTTGTRAANAFGNQRSQSQRTMNPYGSKGPYGLGLNQRPEGEDRRESFGGEAAPKLDAPPPMPERPPMPDEGIAMKAVGGLGNLLDLPGSMVRDVINLSNPFDQLLTPFSAENRTRGTDLRKYAYSGDGVTTGEKVGLFATDIGLEILLDPLTYMTVGATAALKAGTTAGKAARAASRAGLLDDAAKAASKKLGRKVGKREAMQNLTVDELLDFTKQKDPLRATASRVSKREEFARSLDTEINKLNKQKADQIRKEIGSTKLAEGAVNFKLPGNLVNFTFGGEKTARGLDIAGEAIRYSLPVRVGASQFVRNMQGQVSKKAQIGAAESASRIAEDTATAKYRLAEPLANINRVIPDDLDQVKKTELGNLMYEYLEDIGRGGAEAVRGFRPDGKEVIIGKTFEESAESFANQQKFQQLRDLDVIKDLDIIKEEYGIALKAAQESGVPIEHLDDLFASYAARTRNADDGPMQRAKSKSTYNPKSEFAIKRQDYLRNLPRGTAQIQELSTKSPAEGGVAGLIAHRKKVGKKTTADDLAREKEQFQRNNPDIPEENVSGLFDSLANRPIEQVEAKRPMFLENPAQSAVRAVNNLYQTAGEARGLSRFIKQNAKLPDTIQSARLKSELAKTRFARLSGAASDTEGRELGEVAIDVFHDMVANNREGFGGVDPMSAFRISNVEDEGVRFFRRGSGGGPDGAGGQPRGGGDGGGGGGGAGTDPTDPMGAAGQTLDPKARKRAESYIKRADANKLPKKMTPALKSAGTDIGLEYKRGTKPEQWAKMIRDRVKEIDDASSQAAVPARVTLADRISNVADLNSAALYATKGRGPAPDKREIKELSNMLREAADNGEDLSVTAEQLEAFYPDVFKARQKSAAESTQKSKKGGAKKGASQEKKQSDVELKDTDTQETVATVEGGDYENVRQKIKDLEALAKSSGNDLSEVINSIKRKHGMLTEDEVAAGVGRRVATPESIEGLTMKQLRNRYQTLKEEYPETYAGRNPNSTQDYRAIMTEAADNGHLVMYDNPAYPGNRVVKTSEADDIFDDITSDEIASEVASGLESANQTILDSIDSIRVMDDDELKMAYGMISRAYPETYSKEIPESMDDVRQALEDAAEAGHYLDEVTPKKSKELSERVGTTLAIVQKLGLKRKADVYKLLNQRMPSAYPKLIEGASDYEEKLLDKLVSAVTEGHVYSLQSGDLRVSRELRVPGRKARVGKLPAEKKKSKKKEREAPKPLDPNANYEVATAESIEKMSLTTLRRRFRTLSRVFGDNQYPNEMVNSFSPDRLKSIMQEAAERGHLVSDPRYKKANTVRPIPTRPATQQDIIKLSQSPTARRDLQKLYRRLSRMSDNSERGFAGLYPDMRADRDISEFVEALIKAADNGHIVAAEKYSDNLMVPYANQVADAEAVAKARVNEETTNVIDDFIEGAEGEGIPDEIKDLVVELAGEPQGSARYKALKQRLDEVGGSTDETAGGVVARRVATPESIEGLTPQKLRNRVKKLKEEYPDVYSGYSPKTNAERKAMLREAADNGHLAMYDNPAYEGNRVVTASEAEDTVSFVDDARRQEDLADEFQGEEAAQALEESKQSLIEMLKTRKTESGNTVPYKTLKGFAKQLRKANPEKYTKATLPLNLGGPKMGQALAKAAEEGDLVIESGGKIKAVRSSQKAAEAEAAARSASAKPKRGELVDQQAARLAVAILSNPRMANKDIKDLTGLLKFLRSSTRENKKIAEALTKRLNRGESRETLFESGITNVAFRSIDQVFAKLTEYSSKNADEMPEITADMIEYIFKAGSKRDTNDARRQVAAMFLNSGKASYEAMPAIRGGHANRYEEIYNLYMKNLIDSATHDVTGEGRKVVTRETTTAAKSAKHRAGHTSTPAGVSSGKTRTSSPRPETEDKLLKYRMFTRSASSSVQFTKIARRELADFEDQLSKFPVDNNGNLDIDRVSAEQSAAYDALMDKKEAVEAYLDEADRLGAMPGYTTERAAEALGLDEMRVFESQVNMNAEIPDILGEVAAAEKKAATSGRAARGVRPQQHVGMRLYDKTPPDWAVASREKIMTGEPLTPKEEQLALWIIANDRRDAYGETITGVFKDVPRDVIKHAEQTGRLPREILDEGFLSKNDAELILTMYARDDSGYEIGKIVDAWSRDQSSFVDDAGTKRIAGVKPTETKTITKEMLEAGEKAGAVWDSAKYKANQRAYIEEWKAKVIQSVSEKLKDQHKKAIKKDADRSAQIAQERSAQLDKILKATAGSPLQLDEAELILKEIAGQSTDIGRDARAIVEAYRTGQQRVNLPASGKTINPSFTSIDMVDLLSQKVTPRLKQIGNRLGIPYKKPDTKGMSKSVADSEIMKTDKSFIRLMLNELRENLDPEGSAMIANVEAGAIPGVTTPGVSASARADRNEQLRRLIREQEAADADLADAPTLDDVDEIAAQRESKAESLRASWAAYTGEGAEGSQLDDVSEIMDVMNAFDETAEDAIARILDTMEEHAQDDLYDDLMQAIPRPLGVTAPRSGADDGSEIARNINSAVGDSYVSTYGTAASDLFDYVDARIGMSMSDLFAASDSTVVQRIKRAAAENGSEEQLAAALKAYDDETTALNAAAASLVKASEADDVIRGSGLQVPAMEIGGSEQMTRAMQQKARMASEAGNKATAVLINSLGSPLTDRTGMFLGSSNMSDYVFPQVIGRMANQLRRIPYEEQYGYRTIEHLLENEPEAFRLMVADIQAVAGRDSSLQFGHVAKPHSKLPETLFDAKGNPIVPAASEAAENSYIRSLDELARRNPDAEVFPENLSMVGVTNEEAAFVGIEDFFADGQPKSISQLKEFMQQRSPKITERYMDHESVYRSGASEMPMIEVHASVGDSAAAHAVGSVEEVEGARFLRITDKASNDPSPKLAAHVRLSESAVDNGLDGVILSDPEEAAQVARMLGLDPDEALQSVSDAGETVVSLRGVDPYDESLFQAANSDTAYARIRFPKGVLSGDENWWESAIRTNIQAFDKADARSFTHEMGHLMRYTLHALGSDTVKKVDDLLISEIMKDPRFSIPDASALRNKDGSLNYKYMPKSADGKTRGNAQYPYNMDEYFADFIMDYMAGRYDKRDQGAKSVFSLFKNYVASVWSKFKGTPAEERITSELSTFLDELVGPNNYYMAGPTNIAQVLDGAKYSSVRLMNKIADDIGDEQMEKAEELILKRRADSRYGGQISEDSPEFASILQEAKSRKQAVTEEFMLQNEGRVPNRFELAGAMSGAKYDDVDLSVSVKEMLSEFRIDDDVVGDIRKVAMEGRQLINQNATIVALWDAFMNTFKTNVTATNPGFHVRNGVSGFMQNALNDVYDPKPRAGALADLPAPFKAMAIAPFMKRYLAPYGNSMTVMLGKDVKHLAEDAPVLGFMKGQDAEATDELVRLGFAYGLLETPGQQYDLFGASAQVAADAIPGADNLEKGKGIVSLIRKRGARNAPAKKSESFNMFKVAGGFAGEDKFFGARYGRAIGDVVEAGHRLGGFIALIKQGYSPSEAAKRVKLLHVDYANLSDVEREYLRRFFPFYSYARGMSEYVVKELSTRPGGKVAQTIRAANVGRQQDPTMPDYVAKGLAIPLGESEDGAKTYLTGLNLMHEQPVGLIDSFLSGASASDKVQSGLFELASQTAPPFKLLGELATNRSLFLSGPDGGRSLDSLDPPVGRALANITGREQAYEIPGGKLSEALISNSPVSRYVHTVRQVTDDRKSVGQRAVSSLFGAKISTISPAAQDAVLRERASALMRDLGGKVFTRSYIDDETLAAMPPAQRAKAEQYMEIMRVLGQRTKARKAIEEMHQAQETN